MASSAYNTGSEGENLLREHLIAQGRNVEASDNKTFDLKVDGFYAEVKSSNGPYQKLGFIQLTENQYKAMTEGNGFILFLVCNLARPAELQVVEIHSNSLRSEEPGIEKKYFWYRSQLDRVQKQ